MIKNCRIFDYLLITLSIISIIYFIILVINSRFITAYFIYPIFSIITGFYSFYELKNKVSILSNLPKGINYSIKAILILGISFIVSSVTVYFRDLQHLIGVALQLLFYATPIVYAAESIPENFAWILNLNPMTYVINAYRDIFYNQTMPDITGLLIVFIISVLICVIGYFIFNKLQKRFAEEL